MEKKSQKKRAVSDAVDIKVTMPYSLLTAFDEELKRHSYSTRSEAVRETIRRQMEIWTGRRY